MQKPELRGEDFTFVSLNQVHSDTVHIVKTLPFDRLNGDALITGLPKVFLSIRTADCLPILIVSTNPKAVAAVHCGWRGTCNGLVKKVVETMIRTLGSTPDSLVAALGPSIEQMCYEVGEDVKKNFQTQKDSSLFFRTHLQRVKKYKFDLKGMNRSQLLDVGVADKNIFSVDLCTKCDKNYFSYRRDTDEKGRLINFIGMSF